MSVQVVAFNLYKIENMPGIAGIDAAAGEECYQRAARAYRAMQEASSKHFSSSQSQSQSGTGTSMYGSQLELVNQVCVLLALSSTVVACKLLPLHRPPAEEAKVSLARHTANVVIVVVLHILAAAPGTRLEIGRSLHVRYFGNTLG